MDSSDREAAFWGDRAKITDPATLRCKGNWLGARPRFVKSRFGALAMRRVAEAMAPAQRPLFERPPLSFTWLPITNLYSMDEVIMHEVMGDRLELMDDFGVAIAGYDIGFLYRAFFRMGSPEFFLGRSHLIFNQYVSEGNVRTVAKKGEAETVIHGIVLPRYLCRFGIAGYMRGAVLAAGGSGVHITHTRCVHDGDDECAYRSRWH